MSHFMGAVPNNLQIFLLEIGVIILKPLVIVSQVLVI